MSSTHPAWVSAGTASRSACRRARACSGRGLPCRIAEAQVRWTNRHYNYITVRDPNTGERFKVDVRQMDTRRSVNVWRLRPGDRISVNGGWENSDTFQASTVNF